MNTVFGHIVAIAIFLGGAHDVYAGHQKSKRVASPTQKSVRSTRMLKPVVMVPARHSSEKHLPVLSLSLSQKQIATIEVYEDCKGIGPRLVTDELRVRALDKAFDAQRRQPMRGTPEKLGTEICVMDLFGLGQFKDTPAIIAAMNARELVPINTTEVVFSERLPPDQRFARPFVDEYISRLAGDMSAHFGSSPVLRIGSLVRSVDEQAHLVRIGKSPARCDIPALCSSHPKGAAVDISLQMLDGPRFRWLNERLQEDIAQYKIFAIKERDHFHVTVLPEDVVSWYRTSRSLHAQE